MTTMILLHQVVQNQEKDVNWCGEKSKLKNLKAKLDEAYLEELGERQRLTSARLSGTEEPSARLCPTYGPRWDIRSE